MLLLNSYNIWLTGCEIEAQYWYFIHLFPHALEPSSPMIAELRNLTLYSIGGQLFCLSTMSTFTDHDSRCYDIRAFQIPIYFWGFIQNFDAFLGNWKSVLISQRLTADLVNPSSLYQDNVRKDNVSIVNIGSINLIGESRNVMVC